MKNLIKKLLKGSKADPNSVKSSLNRIESSMVTKDWFNSEFGGDSPKPIRVEIVNKYDEKTLKTFETILANQERIVENQLRLTEKILDNVRNGQLSKVAKKKMITPKIILAEFEKNPILTVKYFREKFEATSARVCNHLRTLVLAGKLERIGEERSGKYKKVER